MAKTRATQGGRSYSARIFLPLAVPFVILIAVGVFALVSNPKPAVATPAPGVRGSLVWGDGIFARTVEMKAWQRLHGGSYGSWAKQHPAGLSLIRPRVIRARLAAAHRAARKSASTKP